ncbi:hypothetical protein GCM10010365_54340 [Streptomyces poonensis]|uniref:Uncharacterized protein n=1 Tax=Streptomyces poonensis TaxID=68255 RepID=A0A918PYJ7_9ACTN|nr:hypothetical protein GCM10010365_54340 [Streptomyces poonensis]GLJ93825.1 hypothetical protein GCM10017589_64420 [Streptomyces poonensis]
MDRQLQHPRRLPPFLALYFTAKAAMAHGTRPLRTHIDPSRDGGEVVSAVADRVRADSFRRIGLDSLLTAGSSL